MDNSTKIPLATTGRNSKSLIETIHSVQDVHQDAQESLEEGQWVIRDGEAILGGPSPTQWGAWTEAAYGSSRSQ